MMRASRFPANAPTALLAAVLAALLQPTASRSALSTADAPPRQPSRTAADAEEVGPEEAQKELCTLIETAATDNGLPVGFFTRLIWKESRFRHDAVSPKGAQGIAQFMPGTALERGLDDPFDARSGDPGVRKPSRRPEAPLRQSRPRRGGLQRRVRPGAATGFRRLRTAPLRDARLRALDHRRARRRPGRIPTRAPKLPAEPGRGTDCLSLAALLKGPGSAACAGDRDGARALGRPGRRRLSQRRARSTPIRSLKQRFAALFADRLPMIIGGRMPGAARVPSIGSACRSRRGPRARRLCTKLKRAGGSCIVLKT